MIPTTSTRFQQRPQTPLRLISYSRTMDGDDANQTSSVSEPILVQEPQAATQSPINVTDEPPSKLANESKLSDAAGNTHTDQVLDSVPCIRIGDSGNENATVPNTDGTAGSGDTAVVGEEQHEWMPDIDHESKRVKVSTIFPPL